MKKFLRILHREGRQAMTPTTVTQQSEKIAAQAVKFLAPFFNNKLSVNIGMYLPIDNEVDCFLVAKALDKTYGDNIKLQFLYSQVTCHSNRRMRFFPITTSQMDPANITVFFRGPQLRYPIQHVLLECLEPMDFILVPLVAFDSSLNRIGFGRGYYDFYLNQKPTYSVGLAYNHQKIDEKYHSVFDHDEFNHPLDAVVTETSVYQKRKPSP
jgi:5-formyltetrahydrofolate cyclo-ligase